jgi:tRNA U34 5-methylaminomethyl-2-thiouridine-forming methyltransferase MnmC
LKKFIEPAGLAYRLRNNSRVRLLDVGFGLGYNAVAAARLAEETGCAYLEIRSLENDLNALKAALSLLSPDSLHSRVVSSLLEHGCWRGEFAEIKLVADDARRAVTVMENQFDCIFMDGFSPDKNPELWTYDFIRCLARRLCPEGVIVTYSSAYPVRGALLRCGLQLGMSEAFGRKRGGTVAVFSPPENFIPLPPKELGIIRKSTAGAAYRDPGLCTQAKAIIAGKQKLVFRLRRLGIPKWYKDAY